MKLFIDDERVPTDVAWVHYDDDKEDFNIIRDAETFVHFMSQININNLPKVVSFDHDLQLGYASKAEVPQCMVQYADYHKLSNYWEITGFGMLKCMIDRLLDLEATASQIKHIQVHFHTQNPVGRKNMELHWDSFIDFLSNPH